MVAESSSSEDEDTDDEGDKTGTTSRVLRAGLLVRDEGGAGGARRHQEGAVEARGSLGGGGKRGWVG